MNKGFEMHENCNCKTNENEQRRSIEIEAGANKNELFVTEIIGAVRSKEQVFAGQATTPFGRSFSELLNLGLGPHSICNCVAVGRAGTISKTRSE
jgi:hypothetical protein